jgi:hypothetical protein
MLLLLFLGLYRGFEFGLVFYACSHMDYTITTVFTTPP